MRLISSHLIGLSVLAAAPRCYGQSENPSMTVKEIKPEVCGNAASFAGYVKFPPNTMKSMTQPNKMNFFYWYFPAQENPENAPVVVWLNGGPGVTDMAGIFTEVGPCTIDKDLKQTANPNSWNKKHNMLFIDQPLHVGFSHDTPTKGFLNVLNDEIMIPDDGQEPPKGNTIIPGTFSSQDPLSTANTTVNAARHFWNFMQVFQRDFLDKKPSNGKLSIWAESFGGHYSPVFARYIHDQNVRIRQGELNDSRPIELSTVGVMNGCVDDETEILSRSDFAFDQNTYGIQHISKEQRDLSADIFDSLAGCRDKLRQCKELGLTLDPLFTGNNSFVNKVCHGAAGLCSFMDKAYFEQTVKRSTYDITQCGLINDTPHEFYREYLSQESIMKELDVPVNLTDFSLTVFRGLHATGDSARGGIGIIASLLNLGIPVAMVYGDRDWICNWKGGEKVSLHLKHDNAPVFGRAGYADIKGDKDKVIGQVREAGMLSFSRVFQASHMVAASQPEAALTVFQRAMARKDIATGKTSVTREFATEGSAQSTASSEKPAAAQPVCRFLSLGKTCGPDQIEAVLNGTAVIEGGTITSPGLPAGICPT
ncbi:Peptidase S10, serine carboxypeptidase [Ophiocordyceps camponoti-floridani]|uniref:Peptidase S10, serine carboxypeptidase n=1 Tax=Ophiocordyceps camponoti-floridani TaxID=2030778 RepID=A0A8H4Q8T3_9HYPO|nr:Peptidase S10, serine carboxypeptidase [Ophiocordyceps camponoti-floridani]